MKNQTDEYLMSLIIGGDEGAFGILVKRYLSKALLFADNYVGSYSEDIVQEVFIKIWKNAYRFNPEKAQFNTWFYTILTNSCYSKAKKENRIKTVEIVDNLTDSGESIEKILIDKQVNKNLRLAMLKLSKREQEVLMLRYFSEYSNKDTAEIMKTTVKAIETLLIRSRKKLHKIMIRGK